ncbi:Gfo/Idh/MocA family oxidoreductase [Marinobacter nanhaiticus D15-8W]|uniref:Oxidoreductase n=1 Tax=Marinobacter nanhaiticus D15-8W TaxID=626887 RepID=N6X602_9GAMM|nr:Gfo/Idh/MocA family oxidoreductase [Marinobacter nanhaiticus]ENO16528.1 oxidoreductase [Marinobacter nanhaiticus D15-8W]BES72319.1 Gfo/Idh/MocA family oxidoreductase [Marinobacter nanhaiticus D15-8W]
MSENNEVRVGIIGYGLAGSVFHAPLIDAARGLRLSAIVTSNPDRAGEAKQAYPNATLYDTAGQLWHDADKLDLVVIASPNRTHKPLAMAALHAGLGVVVDKPLAAHADDARELADEAERLGLFLTVFQNRRWDSDFLTLQQLMVDGELGEVRRFESRFERWRPEPKPGWRQSGAPEEAGGVLYDLGAHLIDQALVLFGPVKSVYAELEHRYPDAEVDDDSFVALTHHNGVRSHLWMSSVAAQCGPRMRVLGSRAAYTSFGLDGQENALKAGARPDQSDWLDNVEDGQGYLTAGSEERAIQNVPGGYLRFYERVAETFRKGEKPPVDPREAIAGLEIVAAAQHASAERRVIELPE